VPATTAYAKGDFITESRYIEPHRSTHDVWLSTSDLDSVDCLEDHFISLCNRLKGRIEPLRAALPSETKIDLSCIYQSSEDVSMRMLLTPAGFTALAALGLNVEFRVLGSGVAAMSPVRQTNGSKPEPT
jgi:hypothetical protein